ncbi:hypothetical protein TNCV_1853991 [Trichonephila clavipes]|nr:hypothetical protein TNCV_1853991 [Trichonephila clavipes]
MEANIRERPLVGRFYDSIGRLGAISWEAKSRDRWMIPSGRHTICEGGRPRRSGAVESVPIGSPRWKD